MVDLRPRILIQGGALSTLLVSLPGRSVIGATLNELAFDARGAALKILARGVHNLNMRDVNSATHTVDYVAQPRPPFCCCWFRQYTAEPGGNGPVVFTDDFALNPYRVINTSGQTRFRDVVITPSRAVFRIRKALIDNGAPISSYQIGYVFFVAQNDAT